MGKTFKELEDIASLQKQTNKFKLVGKTIDQCLICKHHLHNDSECFYCTEAQGTVIAIKDGYNYTTNRLSDLKITNGKISGFDMMHRSRSFSVYLSDVQKVVLFYGEEFKIFTQKDMNTLLSEISGKETMIFIKYKK